MMATPPAQVGGAFRGDLTTKSQVLMSYAHAEIHDGYAFHSDAQAAAASLILAFKTPPGTVHIHLLVEFATFDASHYTIIEGPTWTPETGTQNLIINRNRNKLNSSIILEDKSGSFVVSNNVLKDPTGLAGGSEIAHIYAFQGKPCGPTRRDKEEIVLKSDTTYTVKLDSDDGVKGLFLLLEWYEHNDLTL